METCKVYYCYKATNRINGRGYIGFATNPQTRWRNHKRDAELGRGFVFHAAIRKYGWGAFEFEVLCCGKDKREMLGFVEPLLIEQHHTLVPQGYNVYRKAGRPKKSNGLTVKTFTQAHRNAISTARKGMKFSEAHRHNLSLSHQGQPSWNKGKHPTAETRHKLSAALQGVARAAQQWIVIHPDGTTEPITNMKAFCRDHNLSPGLMTMVSQGKAKHHKGFICTKVTECRVGSSSITRCECQ